MIDVENPFDILLSLWYSCGMETNTLRYVAYYRVSTKRQGRSGLGLAAQQTDVAHLVCSYAGSVEIAHYTEIETREESRSA